MSISESPNQDMLNALRKRFEEEQRQASRSNDANVEATSLISNIKMKKEGVKDFDVGFLTATSKLKTVPEDRWWEREFQTNLKVTIPLRQLEIPEKEEEDVKEEVREATLYRLGFFDEKGTYTGEAGMQLLKPYEDSLGTKIRFAQSHLFPNIFLIYAMKQIRNSKNHRASFFSVSELIRYVSNPQVLIDSFKPIPAQSAPRK